mgnify:CR=1 FL=1
MLVIKQAAFDALRGGELERDQALSWFENNKELREICELANLEPSAVKRNFYKALAYYEAKKQLMDSKEKQL